MHRGLLTSGGKDSLIQISDKRRKGANLITLERHKHEVCGLVWNDEGTMLASGGNDDKVYIWNISNLKQPCNRNTMEHKAAVKALAWCPFQSGILATGGGTADTMIKIWNTMTEELQFEINSESQVTSLVWNNIHKELLSSHGYQHNQVSIWAYADYHKVIDLRGHKDRVLNMCINPTHTMIVTASADESLRFWRISEKECSKDKKASSITKNGTLIPASLR